MKPPDPRFEGMTLEECERMDRVMFDSALRFGLNASDTQFYRELQNHIAELKKKEKKDGKI